MTLQTKVNCRTNRCFFRWITLLFLATLSNGRAMDVEPVPQVDLIAEVRVPVSSGSVTDQRGTVVPAKGVQYVFKKAGTLTEGQEIFYTVRIRNPGMKTIHHADVTERIPANTRYISGTATGAGSQILFSIDGGQQFMEAAALPAPVLSMAGHPVTVYTHVRWQLGAPLAPGAVMLARFRAEFQ